MLSKSQIKYIRSFHRKKLRHTHRLYLAEGEKIIDEYLTSDADIKSIFATGEWLVKNQMIVKRKEIEFIEISEGDLKKISSLKTPNNVIGLVAIPSESFSAGNLAKGLHLVLENIQDPGNLGTIIRIADWFGIDNVICSPDCVDVYNPKTVQSTMGSLARIKVHYTDLFIFLKEVNLPVIATALTGENIYEAKLPSDALIIIGNESQGISQQLMDHVSRKICIPKFGKAESLNAAIAAAIVVSCFKKE